MNHESQNLQQEGRQRQDQRKAQGRTDESGHSQKKPLEIPKRVKNYTGFTTGRMTFTEYAGTDGHHSLWRGVCSCGNAVIRSSGNIKKSQSCGCVAVEKVSTLSARRSTHGHSTRKNTSPEYRTWSLMKVRCSPESEHRKFYFERGIMVCPRWAESFLKFLEDMGSKPSPNHSIDRINNDGNYDPTNCRWATRTQQDDNKRGLIIITHDGRTQCLAAWARESGLKTHVVYGRIRAGWSYADAFTTPVKAK